jgi:hypothetical protein
MIPKRSGDRVKTDRRDSQMLARLHRAGELRAISVPDSTDEAMRDLVRAREDAVGVSSQAKYRLKVFLRRQGRRYPGRQGWTLRYRRWLTDLSFPSAAQHLALQNAGTRSPKPRRESTGSQSNCGRFAPTWRWAPVVAALQALRGVSFLRAFHAMSPRLSARPPADKAPESGRQPEFRRADVQSGESLDTTTQIRRVIVVRGDCQPW